MNNRSACDHKPIPRASFLWLFIAGAAMAGCGNAGHNTIRNTVPFADLFSIHVDTAQGETYLNFGPDSIPGNSQLNARCTALWYYHLYLFENYAEVYNADEQLLAILPDTVAMRNKFRALLDADTAFQKLYMRSINRVDVAPLSMDSALVIASHFFYLHRENGRPTVHVCTGINKVQEMSSSTDHPQHVAFCYMAIREMEDPFALLDQVIEPFRTELKANPSDERLTELEHLVYDTLSRSPELRKALLDTYEQKAQYLNFKLVK
ncbi:MAG: hypothetical protein WBG34_04060 [Flavobacteriales bacterium]